MFYSNEILAKISPNKHNEVKLCSQAISNLIQKIRLKSIKSLLTPFRLMETPMRAAILGVFLSNIAGGCATFMANKQESRGTTISVLDGATKNLNHLDAEKVLTEYPISKRIAVIINGDSEEERHIENVESAIEVLKNKGFKDFYIASDQELSKKEINLKQFEGSVMGVDQLFEALSVKGVLVKDALLFFYTTGHGNIKDDKGCLVLKDECYKQDEMVSNLQIVKNTGARGIFIMDQCQGGSMPSAIIDSGIKGIAMSPGIEGGETACQFFSPDFFKHLKNNYDSNSDGISEPSEWFHAAMAGYQINTGLNEHGEYIQSRPELTLENFETAMQSKKVVIIDVNATWCGPCKIYSRTLDELNGMVGEQIKIMNLTVDTNQEAQVLFEKLGVQEPASIPATLIRELNGTFKLVIGALPLTDILDKLDNVGVKVSVDTHIKLLVKKTGYSKEVVSKFVDSGIIEPGFMSSPIKSDDIEELVCETIHYLAKHNSSYFLENVNRYKKGPYFDSALELAVRAMATLKPRQALHQYYDVYRDKPYYNEVIKSVAELMAMIPGTAEFTIRNAEELAINFKDKPLFYKALVENAVEIILTEHDIKPEMELPYIKQLLTDFKKSYSNDNKIQCTIETIFLAKKAELHWILWLIEPQKNEPWAKDLTKRLLEHI